MPHASKELSVYYTRCLCGWSVWALVTRCPVCGMDLDLLTQWWQETSDHHWGKSEEQLAIEFAEWSAAQPV